MRSRSFLHGLTLLVVLTSIAAGQADDSSRTDRSLVRLMPPSSAEWEWQRLLELQGVAKGTYPLLRSPSSAIEPATPGVRLLAPYFSVEHLGGVPSEGNDGALWAGLGWSTRTIAGFRADWGPVHLIVAPELLYSQNNWYPLHDSTWYGPLPASRSSYGAPWYAGPHSADLPLRMGGLPLRRVEAGQSAFYLEAGPVDVGAATENEWWGPAVRNALLLSDNAPGFPHAFLRTRAPVATRIGVLEARWLVGGLRESAWYDDEPSNDLRSISMLALAWRPSLRSGISLGMARAVFAPSSGWGRALGDFPQVFADVGQPNRVPDTDSTRAPGRDQLLSLFGRWLFADDGVELYAEWTRAAQPLSLRDMLLEPTNSQAYTVGAQWVSKGAAWGRTRVRTELTNLEQSATFRNHPVGWTYASRAVEQGYTNRGQSLGAAIGSGASSQYVELGWLRESVLAGISLERVRYNDDAYNALKRSTFCRHDVSVRPGVRGSWISPVGTWTLDYVAGYRTTPFFRYGGSDCTRASPEDASMRTLRISLGSARLP